MRHEAVHQVVKASGVAGLEQVDKLMHQDVFQAGLRFFASSRFSQIRRAVTLQEPQRVFIFLILMS